MRHVSRLLLALDGGGTKTICLLGTTDGQVVGLGRGGPVNVGFVPVEVAHRSIEAAARAALGGAPPRPRLALVCAGATVAVEVIEAALRPWLAFDRLSAPGEAPCCLASGTADEHGAVILSGTGCFQWARGRDGRVHRTDGWGALLGDQGSAYDIVRAALVAAARAVDGRGPATCLVDRFCAHFGEPDLKAVGRRIYGGRLARHEIAALAPLVTRTAAEGDRVAQTVLAGAALHLAEGAEVCARRAGLDGEPFDLVLQGGVMRAGPPILDPLRAELARRLPTARVVLPAHGPELGAFRIGLQQLGVALDPELLERTERSLRALTAAGASTGEVVNTAGDG